MVQHKRCNGRDSGDLAFPGASLAFDDDAALLPRLTTALRAKKIDGVTTAVSGCLPPSGAEDFGSG
jgi:hypothetical protein